MQLPAGSFGPASGSPSIRPTGTPSTRSHGQEPKFVSTSTPIVVSPTRPARRPDSSLPVEADHARAGADGTLLEVGCGRRDRAAGVGRLDVHDPRLAQPAVVAFAHARDDDVLGDTDLGLRGHRDSNGAVVDAADRVGRRQVDGGVEQPPLANPVRAGQLAGAVEDRHAGGDVHLGWHDRL